MADEPSARAQWNVKVFINLAMLVGAAGIIAYGLAVGQLTVQEALSHVAAAAFGGGVTWLAK